MVPLSSVHQTKLGTMALSVNHLSQLPAVTVSFNLAPGVALSDAVSAITRVQHRIGMPPGIQAVFQGTAQAFQTSTANMGILLLRAFSSSISCSAFSMRASSTR